MDSRGVPVAGATVFWSDVGPPSWPWPGGLQAWDEAGQVTSDHKGHFSIQTNAASSYQLIAQKPGYHAESVRAHPDDQDIRLTMTRVGWVSGRVFGPEGAPAPGAKVWAAGVDSAVTAADGSFRLRTVVGEPTSVDAERTYRTEFAGVSIELACRGSATAVLTDRLPQSGLTIRLESPPVSAVPVRVVGADAGPSTGCKIRIQTGVLTPNTLVTGTEGRVLHVVPRPPGSTVYIDITDRFGWWRRVEAATLPERSGEEIVVRLAAPVRFSVEVNGPDGEPLPGDARVEVFAPQGRQISRDANRIEMRVPGGTHQSFSINAEGYCSDSKLWQPQSGDQYSVTLEREACVRGYVLGPHGKPVRGRIQCGAAYARIDTDGQFRIGKLRSGRHALLVLVAAGPPLLEAAEARREFTVRSGETLELRPIVLSVRAHISGCVLRPDGGRAAGAQVIAIDKDLGLVAFAQSDLHGRFAIRAPDRAGVRLVAWRPGMTAALSPVVVGGGNSLVLQLQRESTVVVRARSALSVQTQDGFPLPLITRWSDKHQGELLFGLPAGIIRFLPDEGSAVDTSVVPGHTTEIVLE